jgi:hypothetical protein
MRLSPETIKNSEAICPAASVTVRAGFVPHEFPTWNVAETAGKTAQSI